MGIKETVTNFFRGGEPIDARVDGLVEAQIDYIQRENDMLMAEADVDPTGTLPTELESAVSANEQTILELRERQKATV